MYNYLYPVEPLSECVAEMIGIQNESNAYNTSIVDRFGFVAVQGGGEVAMEHGVHALAV